MVKPLLPDIDAVIRRLDDEQALDYVRYLMPPQYCDKPSFFGIEDGGGVEGVALMEVAKIETPAEEIKQL